VHDGRRVGLLNDADIHEQLTALDVAGAVVDFLPPARELSTFANFLPLRVAMLHHLDSKLDAKQLVPHKVHSPVLSLSELGHLLQFAALARHGLHSTRVLIGGFCYAIKTQEPEPDRR
jgi:hypothetical protein